MSHKISPTFKPLPSFPFPSFSSAFALLSGTGVSNRPDLRLDQLLKTADHILLALDYEDDVRRHILWWQQHYPQVTVWFAPECKSIGDAFKKGCDIREWVLRGVLESTEPSRISC